MGSDRIRAFILTCVVTGVFLSSFILVREGHVFISPDETANAVFASQVATTGSPALFDAYNLSFSDHLYPRSTISINGRIVPSGFLGLPVLFGWIAALIGLWTIPLLLPCIAAAAVFCWYAIVRRVFDRDIAFVSSILLAIHPAWWYYEARTLMPNVLFASLVIIGVWLLLIRPVRAFALRQKRSLPGLSSFDVGMAGICTGWALFVRPSEVWWLLLGALIFVWPHRRHIIWPSVGLFAAGCAIALLPMLFFDQSLYGNPFVTGYQAHASGESLRIAPEPCDPSSSGACDTLDAPTPAWWLDVQKAVSPLLPFGVHPRTLMARVEGYGLSLFWWMTILTLLGLPLLLSTRALSKEAATERRAYGLATLLVSAYLAVLYGSWVFHDNPDPEHLTIANSYVRYWLPIFILTTPYAAASLWWIARRAITPLAQRIALCAMLVLCAAFSVHAVFFAPEDGLVYAAEALHASRLTQAAVLSITEPDSVMVVDRADKLFWPHRHVRYPLRSEETYQLMPEIAMRVPLYYYGITFPDKDVAYLNDDKLKSLGLQIILLKTFGEESLYRIYPSH